MSDERNRLTWAHTKRRVRFVFICLLTLGLVLGVWQTKPVVEAAPTTLAAGDIAIIGFNSDDTDQFAFVLLRDIGSGTVINFTDDGWYAAGGFRTNEGVYAWTAATDLVAGTVVSIEVTTPPANFVFSVSGDQIIAFQGTLASPTVIYAVNSEGTGWQADATSSNTSALPTGLTNGTTAIALNEIDNAIYVGPTTGTVAQLLAAIGNPANWSGDNTNPQTMPPGPFTIITGTDDAPTVNSDTTPANGATGVELDTDIQIQFSETVNVSTASFTISCTNSGAHTFVLTGSGTDYVLNPDTNFTDDGDVCTVTVLAAEVTDQDGDDPPDNMAANYVFSFNALISDVPPTVSSTTPANGATEVATDTTITVNFGEAVTLTASAITLECPVGTPITFSGLPAANISSVTLTPATLLPEGVTCTVTVVAGQVNDTDVIDPPDTMTTNYVFSFTTAAPPPALVINEVDYDQPGIDTAEFIEILNRGSSAVSLANVSVVLVDGNGGVNYQTYNLPAAVSLAAGDYFVVCANTATTINCDLDVTPDTNLIQNGNPDAIALRFGSVLIDAVSYEGNTIAPYTEGTGTIAPDDAAAPGIGLSRSPDGTDSNNNNADFAQRCISPGIANLSTSTNCVPSADLSLSKTVDNGNPDSGDTIVFTLTVSNAGPNNTTGVTVGDVLPAGVTYVSDDGSGSYAAGVWTVGNLNANASATLHITVTVTAANGTSFSNVAQVTASSSYDSDSQPNNMGANPAQDDEARVTVQVGADPACANPTTAGIYDLQENGSLYPETGIIHTVMGVVTGDFQSTTTGLSGFNIQAATGDGNPATSDGIFVFDNGFGVDVTVGQVVRVTGRVTEYNGLTEIGTVSSVIRCGMGSVSPTTVALPIANLADWENYEGMLITIPNITVEGHYNLGRYGEVIVGHGRLYQATHLVRPGAASIAQADLNARSLIIVDDGSSVSNPPVVPYLAADNTLRAGDIAPQVTGVLSYGFSAYRINPTQPLTFTRANNRAATPPALTTGTLRVSSFNTLNYFTGPTFPTARGASSASELARQQTKLVAAICGMNPDVAGLMEIQNDAAPGSIGTLVNALNATSGCGPYAFVDTGITGTDAIRVAIIYKTTTVVPVGAPAILTSAIDPLFVDTNRPAVAQTFREITNDEVFTIVVNHLKSKGSSCGTGDDDTVYGQGNCNLTRTNAATALVNWLATDPTGSGDPDFLVVGDMNSYAQEDPIWVLRNAGYTDMLNAFGGVAAYSYTYDGQLGYLDHALASASLVDQIGFASDWHINSDEPTDLDYNDDVLDSGEDASDLNQAYLYNTGPWRASDHDPVIIDLHLGSTIPPVVPTATPPSSGTPDIGVFDPALSKIGVLEPGELGLPGEQLTWHITVRNNGTAAGTNIVITDTLRSELRIDSVEADRGTFAISGQTVTFTIPVLNPGEAVELRINTTVLSSPNDGLLTNDATLVGYGSTGASVTRSAQGIVTVTTQLPATGYPPAEQPSRGISWIVVVALIAGLCAVVLRRKLA